MKYLKIKLEDNKSVLVDGDITGIENNVWVYNNGRTWLWTNIMALRSNNKPQLIIATINHSISLDVPMVVLKDDWRNSWEVINSKFRDGVDPHAYQLGWINKAQQKGGYSEADIRNAYDRGSFDTLKCIDIEDNNQKSKYFLSEKERYILSLNQEYIELESELVVTQKKPIIQHQGNDLVVVPHKEIIKTNRIKGQLMAYAKQSRNIYI